MSLEPYTLVYLLGSGRNGSTVIDLILAGHPSVLALGEISTVNRTYDPFEPPPDDYVTRHFLDAYRNFWIGVKEAYESGTGQPFEELDIVHPRLRKALCMSRTEAEPWVRANLAVLRASHVVSGRPILSDASKVPQRLLLLQRSGMVRIKVIHLVRDGRAVCDSYRRRYGSFYGGIRTWAHAELGSLYLRRFFPADDWMEIRYEEFSAKPEAVLREICTFLDLGYNTAMLDIHAHQYLGIGGNPNVKASPSPIIRPDDRWRREMSTARRIVFGMGAGWLNRMNGYPAFVWERRDRPDAAPRS